MYRLLGGDVELVAELTQVGDAHEEHACEADVDLARRAEREGPVGEIRGGDAVEQFA